MRESIPYSLEGAEMWRCIMLSPLAAVAARGQGNSMIERARAFALLDAVRPIKLIR